MSDAIVLGYLANRVRHSTTYRAGRPWFFQSIDDLLPSFPYLKRTTLNDVLTRLEKAGFIQVGNFNRWKKDKTRWFHVPKDICDRAACDPVYFDTEVAAARGIPEALLIVNLRHFIEVRRKAKQEPLEHEMSPALLAELLPLSQSTIKRALKNLVKHGLIRKTSDSKPIYALENHAS